MEAPLSSRETARRFHFLREIASGGFGTVYLTKVMHADGFSRLVAVKLLKSQWTDSDEVARRMRDEARLLGLLRHRNIVDVMDLTAIDGRAAVVMEYLEAVDLKYIVRRLGADGMRLPVRAVLEIGAAVASALDAAYNRPPIPGDKPLRVIHRDIKPSNIMVDETGMVKVLDFGVARSEIDNRESHTQDLQFGSVDYMAPERLFFEPETPASDVYSLGATLYELLALEKLGKGRGRPALHQKTIAARLDGIASVLASAGPHSADVRALIEQSLQYEHESRPTAAEFFQRARRLARTLADEDMASWSERVLPDWIQASQEKNTRPSALDDAILAEDSSAFSGALAAADMISVDGAIGDELRRGALAELEESGALSVSPATGAPRTGASTLPLLDATDEEGATVVSGLPFRGLADGVGAAEGEAEVGSAAASLPEARKSPIPHPPAPPAVAAARARFAPVRPQLPPKAPDADDGTATSEPTWSAETSRGVKATPERPSGPTLIPDDTGQTEPVRGPEEEPATVMMAVDREAAAAARASDLPEDAETLPVGPPAVDEAEGRTVPLHPPPVVTESSDSQEMSRTDGVGRRPGPTVNPTERAPFDPPSAVNARRPVVAPDEPPEDPPSDAPTLPAGLDDGPPPDEPTLRAGHAETADPPVVPSSEPVAVPSSQAADVGFDEPVTRDRRMATSVAAGCLVAVLGLGGLTWGIASNIDALRQAVVEARSPTPSAAPSDPGPHDQGTEVDVPPADGPSIVFRSEDPGTRKLKVRCDADKGQGSAEAVVSLAQADTCTVTAYMRDRSRRTAALQKVEAGEYVCFAADADRCERQ